MNGKTKSGRMRARSASLGIAACATLMACGAVWAATSARWSVNGRVISSNVRIINGQAFVPLSEVARSMNMTVRKNGSTYALLAPGGATQVQGARQGKIGDQLSSGKWGLQVTGVCEVEQYTERYSQDRREIALNSPDDKLVVVDAWLRNNVQKTQSPVLTERYSENTALTDTQGRSFQPVTIDARQELGKLASYAATPMLPAARVQFALVFSVPRDAVVKDLVFSALSYEDVGGKGTDLRVSLSQ